ncbi:hypothetical protein [Methanobrevibacter sp.]|uniref:hypothetical protein n=1 Tax=Methanobrevibacter sp. TaxID=66852 RepID=UPI00386786E0
MKVVDLDYENVLYNLANNVPDEIAKLDYPQKYLRLVAADGTVYDLEVADVTDKEFYLKIMG